MKGRLLLYTTYLVRSTRKQTNTQSTISTLRVLQSSVDMCPRWRASAHPAALGRQGRPGPDGRAARPTLGIICFKCILWELRFSKLATPLPIALIDTTPDLGRQGCSFPETGNTILSMDDAVAGHRCRMHCSRCRIRCSICWQMYYQQI
jgi:hypothetical protein